MRAIKLQLGDFRLFDGAEVLIGKMVTAIAGNNGTGKSTILGLLANSSQLKGRKTLLGKPYIGEFSQLFKADKDHDPTGRKVRLVYEEHGTEMVAEFRTAWQKGERFRVIPRRVRLDGSKTESKVESPVIYLGLSRLYPVGEATGDVTASSRRWKDPSDEEWFTSNYSRILSIHDEIKSVSSLAIPGISSKRGTGVETESYGPVANSAGQDNLGQILLSVLSFKRLREDMGEDWDGGILLIDEVDAALHPAAQLRLVDLLIKEAKAGGFQVVFTTHSTVVLRYLSQRNQQNPTEEPGNIEVAYLTNANGSMRAMRNPSWATIEHGLFVTNPALRSRRVGVFTEDPEGRWFASELLSALCPKVMAGVDFLDVSLGCDQILSLYAGDFAYFRDRVVILDGDVGRERIETSVPPALLRSGGNIVRLPGETRPESVLWEYLSRRPRDGSRLWDDLNAMGITWSSLVESPPDRLYPGKDERNRYKAWFRLYQGFFDRAGVVGHWAEDNPEMAQTFVREFLDAYENVAGRLGASPLGASRGISGA